MSLFKKVANFARNSNARWADRMERRAAADRAKPHNCSNCDHKWGKYCCKHEVEFESYDYMDDHVCDDFVLRENKNIF